MLRHFCRQVHDGSFCPIRIFVREVEDLPLILTIDKGVRILYERRHLLRMPVIAPCHTGSIVHALLHDRPRTATVRTATAATLYRLPRGVFLEAVTGNPHAIQAGEELVRERLAAQGH